VTDPLSLALLLAGAPGLLICVLAAIRAFNLSRVLATPATPIAELTVGLHETRGAIRADRRLESPLSRKPCVWWRLLMEQRQRNRWETVLDHHEGVDAWLDDGGGRVRLEPAKAQVVVSSPQRGRSGIFGVPSAELDELLQRIAAPEAPMVGPYLRFREEVLEDGDRVSAVGGVRKADDGWEMAEEAGILLISDRGESELVAQQQRQGVRWVAGAIISALLLGLYLVR
jgi:hypothetical protein